MSNLNYHKLCRNVDLCNLRETQKITDMSKSTVPIAEMQSNYIQSRIVDFFVDTCAESTNWVYNPTTNLIDVEGDCVLNLQGFIELPNYINFGTINGSFEVNHVNNLISTFGFPKEVSGDFTIIGIGKYTKLNNTDDFPDYVGGTVFIKKCPQIGVVHIQNKPKVIKDSLDDEADEIGLTEEQQEILEFASKLLSDDELNDLEEYFYNCN